MFQNHVKIKDDCNNFMLRLKMTVLILREAISALFFKMSTNHDRISFCKTLNVKSFFFKMSKNDDRILLVKL